MIGSELPPHLDALACAFMRQMLWQGHGFQASFRAVTYMLQHHDPDSAETVADWLLSEAERVDHLEESRPWWRAQGEALQANAIDTNAMLDAALKGPAT